MSDMFHEDVPVDFIAMMFSVMNRAYWHTFQILTKRSDRLKELDPDLSWSPNIWMGVSVENRDYKFRIDDLRQAHAHVKFLSLEPLLGRLTPLNLQKIDWVIVGGESGPKARPMKPEWVTGIRDACLKKGVAFFFKQWGGVRKHKTGRTLEGRTWDELPTRQVAAA